MLLANLQWNTASVVTLLLPPTYSFLLTEKNKKQKKTPQLTKPSMHFAHNTKLLNTHIYFMN